jgi:hypothetical protein
MKVIKSFDRRNRVQIVPMYAIYESAGDYFSQPPAKLKIRKIYIKVRAVILLNRAQNLSAGIILNRPEI